MKFASLPHASHLVTVMMLIREYLHVKNLLCFLKQYQPSIVLQPHPLPLFPRVSSKARLANRREASLASWGQARLASRGEARLAGRQEARLTSRGEARWQPVGIAGVALKGSSK